MGNAWACFQTLGNLESFIVLLVETKLALGVGLI